MAQAQSRHPARKAPQVDAGPWPIVLHAWAAALFAAVVLIVFNRSLFTSGAVIASAHSDIWGQFYPWRQFGFGQLRHGHLPLWNPWLFSGAPFVGAFQSALFYPPNWLHLFLPTAVALNIGIALHVFLAGLFMYCWAAYRRLHWLACISAGLVFMFGGQEFGRVIASNLSNLDTLVWAPLVFLAMDDLTMTRSLRGALLGSAAFAMQVFAGHPQYAFYTAAIAAVYFALNLRAAPRPGRAMAGFVLIFAGGAILASVQFITGLGAIHEAMRSHVGPVFAGTFSFPPENLLTTILPGFFGEGTACPYWGRWFWGEANVYTGVVGCALACFSLGKPHRDRRFALTTLVVILIVGLGRYTPAFWIIYRLPLFASFRGLSKMMFLFVMFVALLAGVGFDRLLRGTSRRIWPAVAIAGSGIVLLGLAAVINNSAYDFNNAWGHLLNWIDWSDNRTLTVPVNLDFLYQTAISAAANACWAGVICLLLAMLLFASRVDRRALWCVPLLMAAELASFAAARVPGYAMSDYHRYIDVVARCLAPLPADARVWAYDQGELFLAGRLNAWGNDPMMLHRYIDFLGNALGVEPDSLLYKTPPPPGHDNRLFRMIRTAGILFLDDHGAHLYPFHPPILPRAELVGDVRVEPDRAALISAMNDPRFDPLHSALVESPISPAPAGPADPGNVTVRDIDSDTLEIEAHANSPCLLVVTDAYAAGWHAQAMPDSDQRQYQVIPADLTLRGIPLSAGRHHLRLVYRPIEFVAGKWTSLAALIAYLAMIGWCARRHIRRATSSAQPT